MRRHALTLLEAVLALAILASVAGVVLSMSVEATARSASLAERRTLARETTALFAMLVSGTLGEPARAPGLGPGGVRWRGEHLDEPFEATRRAISARNPAAGRADAGLARTVAVFEYTIDWRGERVVFLNHR